MPLYDPNHQPRLAPADALSTVHTFLQRCRQWALEQEIPQRLEKVRSGLQPQEAAKLHEWIAYLRFVEHTLHELEAGTLDHWFSGSKPEDRAPAPASPSVDD